VFKREIAYVRAGLLSDPPGLNMYRVRKTLSTGFVVYYCIRTSSALEARRRPNPRIQYNPRT